MAEYEFAIRREVLHSGEETLTPVCRKKSPLSWLNRYNPTPWDRIVMIYGKYTLMDLPEDLVPDLSRAQCIEHIKGYQSELQEEENIAPRILIEEIINFKPAKYDKTSKRESKRENL